MHNYKNHIVWTLTGLVVLLFWFSIRSTRDQMAYTLAALGVWGLTYLINKYWKHEKDQKEE